MKNSSILNIITALLALLFIYVGASKLIDFTGFQSQMSRQVLPASLKPILTWLLPPGELSLGIMLLFQRTQLTGLWLSTIAMLAFTIYVALAVFHLVDKLPCACGTIIRGMTWRQHLWFNLFFLLLSIIGISINYRERRAIRK